MNRVRAVRLGTQYVERGKGGGTSGRRQPGIEDERPRPVHQVLPQYGRSENGTALAGKGFRQRHRHQHMLRTGQSRSRDGPTTVACDTYSVSLVHQQYGVMGQRRRGQ